MCMYSTASAIDMMYMSVQTDVSAALKLPLLMSCHKPTPTTKGFDHTASHIHMEVCVQLFSQTVGCKLPLSVVQATGKAAKAAKPKTAAKPAAAAGKSKGKDNAAGPDVNAAAALEEEAGLLAAVQAVQSAAASDATGAEERLKVALTLLICFVQPCMLLLGASWFGVFQHHTSMMRLPLTQFNRACCLNRFVNKW